MINDTTYIVNLTIFDNTYILFKLHNFHMSYMISHNEIVKERHIRKMSNHTGILQGTIIMDIRNLDDKQADHVEQLVEQLTTEGVSYTYRDSISIDARYEHEYAADSATVHSIIKQLYQDYHDALSVLNIARVNVRTGKRVTYRYDAISKKVMIEESKQQGFVRVTSTPYALV